MSFGINMIFAIILLVFVLVGIPVILFFAIRALIRYNAQQKRGKSVQQEELERMKIDDLE